MKHNDNHSYLNICNLEKRWDSMTVRASFSVEKGTMLALLGQSGCGKSTLLRMICGATNVDCGSIILDNEDITNKQMKHRGIGMVFQDHALFPHLSVQDNVAYGLAARGVQLRERRKEASRFLELFGLAGFEHRNVLTLSGGECQRVALARTLAVRPKVVMFDEPLSALDPELRVALRTQIRNYQQELGLTAIFVTHDIGEALAVSDKIAVMQNGTIIATDTGRALFTTPPNEMTARFFGAGNVIHVSAGNVMLNNDKNSHDIQLNCDSTVIKNSGDTFFVPFAACYLVSDTSQKNVVPEHDLIMVSAIVSECFYAGTHYAVTCTATNGDKITVHNDADKTIPHIGEKVTITIRQHDLIPLQC